MMVTECLQKSVVPTQENFRDVPTLDFRKDPDEAAVNSDHSIEATATPPVEMNGESGGCEDIKARRSLRRSRGVYYGVFDMSSDDDSDSERTLKEHFSKRMQQTKKGSKSSEDCQEEKVAARWIPEEARKPIIDEAPVFYPTEKEFKDTLGYISSIRQKAEPYGICRIIPPPSWRPPCPLKDIGIWKHAKFNTRVQQVEKLQNREPMRKKSLSLQKKKRKRRKRLRFGMTRRRNTSNATEANDCTSDTDEKFGFQSGEDFTLETFQKYADEFKVDYFVRNDLLDVQSENLDSGKSWDPSIDEIEGEYWRIVENPTEEVEVYYGADLETGTFGSGFPKAYPSIERPSSLFSELYAFREPKVWYGIPGSDAVKLEDAMRKHLPRLFEDQPDLLHELVTQLSPSVLISEGVPVYRAIQRSGEFVLTFPRAYHSGFNCGFNCAEAVNVAPMDWLPHGQCAVELYSEQCRKTSLSHDKLLLGAAKEAARALWELSFMGQDGPEYEKWKEACGRNGVLTNAVRARVEMEQLRKSNLCTQTQCREMAEDFDTSNERECFSCFYDLHLSAAGCECSASRFACLAHAELLCSCEANRRYFLFRYQMDDLKTLVEALEGNLSSLRHFASVHLGLPLPSVGNDRSELGQPCESDSKVSSEKAVSDFKRPIININTIDANIDDGDCLASKEKDGCTGRKQCYLDLNIEEPSSQCSRKEEQENSPLASMVLSANSPGTVLGKLNYEEFNAYSSLVRSNSECGPPVSRTFPSELARSSSFPRNTDDASCSGVGQYPRMSSAKLFGVDLLCPHEGLEPQETLGRLKYNVEPLHFGTVMPGKLWSSRQAIFPRGFKSRVKYSSLLDPTSHCNYISEIVDAGILGPLFKVTVEGRQDVAFTCSSAVQCWESVLDSINEEIMNLRKQGKQHLPPLQLPGSIDGLEMFGLLSPSITKVIEALDPHHICSEYWAAKSNKQAMIDEADDSRELVTGSRTECHFARQSRSPGSSKKLFGVELIKSEENEPAESGCHSVEEVQHVLGGLLKKANPEELRMMRRILCSDSSNSSWRTLAIRTLLEEIENINKQGR